MNLFEDTNPRALKDLLSEIHSRTAVAIQHILADGRLEAHREAMLRLLDLVGLPREDLFRSTEELLVEAISRQEEKVAYVDETLAAEAASAD